MVQQVHGRPRGGDPPLHRLIEGCYDKVIDPKAKHITCTRNPALCLEYKGLPKPEKAKNVMVIGAGIGGLMAAEYLKARGHNPTVYEATDAPGGHFVLAGKAPKKQAFTDAVMWDAEESIRVRRAAHGRRRPCRSCPNG